MKPTMANCFIIKKYDTKQPNRIITLEKGTMVYPTVYGAFMAIEDLECDEHNRMTKYAIYRAWIDPNKLDYPYNFKYARQWITGGCYLTREEEFTTFCGGTLRWESITIFILLKKEEWLSILTPLMILNIQKLRIRIINTTVK